MLKVGEAIKISTGSIKSAKLRSGLTALGIIIGIAAVVANFSLGESFNVYFTDEINAQGSNFIIIFSQEPNLFYSDQLEVIKQTAGISAVSPIKQQLGEVRYFSQVKNIEIIGVTEDYQDTSNVTMAKGSFINDRDTFSAVVGAEVANGKFNRNISTRSTLDITFRLKNNNSVTKSFKVKGIIQSPEVAVVGEGNIDRDVSIFIPITTMNQMLNQSDYSAFVAMADSIEDVETASDEVDKRLARNFGVSSRDLDDEDAKP
ncbi:MAG: ABC transporter permease, partial [Methanosarcina sp.]